MFDGRSNTRRVAVATLTAAALVALSACSEGVVDSGGGGGGDGDSPEVTLTLVTAAVESTPNAAVQDWFLDELEERSDGRIAVERTEAYSLCDAPEIAECVRDGRAQIGVTIPDYTPEVFPSTSVVSIPFLGQNWQAIMHSLHDLHVNNADAQAQMESNGLHHVATWPVGRLLIGSNEPVSGPDDLSGLSMRVSGPLMQQLFENKGVNIQAIPAAEAYEAVERGIVDSMAAGMDFPVDYQLREVLSHWTDPGIGQYSSFGMWMQLDAYESMPEDLQQVVDEVAAELSSGVGAQEFNETAAQQCPPMMEAENVEELSAWDESVTASWEDETGDTLQDAWVDLATEQGLENAQGVLDDYLAGLEEHAVDVDDATLACIDEFQNS
ncbi:TRAP transporter substrate-binding protein [Georgenia deserti]|uniref:TRAP transporter substrate-binding protein n=1 Tax=Georgenia deserti TaxID=2093781 RepID=A0ABW4L6V4_9MICO